MRHAFVAYSTAATVERYPNLFFKRAQEQLDVFCVTERATDRAGNAKRAQDQTVGSPQQQYDFLFVVVLLVQTQAGEVGASREIPTHYARYFRALGHRVRSYRVERKLTQEDMISYGFSVRHWQMVESGRPINLFTLLRICEAFDVAPDKLLEGLAHHLRKRRKS